MSSMARKIKNYTFTPFIYALCMFGYSTTFAQDSLVQQAKVYQTGSETVGIDHQKAITLLKQAVAQNDAEAMFLLSEYYQSSADYDYLPENPKLEQELSLKSAKLGHWDAIEYLINKENIQSWYFQDTQVDLKKELKYLIEKGIQQKDPRAYVMMVDYMDEYRSRGFDMKQCKLLYDAYQLGDIWAAGYRLQHCDDTDLKKLNAPMSAEFREKYFNQVKDEIKKYHANQNSTISDAFVINQKFGEVDRDKIILRFEERLEKRIKDFYLDQGKKGYSDAYIKLMNLYPLDEKQRAEWFSKAIKLKNSTALREQGYDGLYDDNANIKVGVNALTQAIEQNNSIAMNILGVWYINEDKDWGKQRQDGIDLLKKAAQLDHLQAMENLALVVEGDEQYIWAIKAFKNMSKNIEVLESAQYAYEKGIGIQKNKNMSNRIKEQIKEIKSNQEVIDEMFGIDEE